MFNTEQNRPRIHKIQDPENTVEKQHSKDHDLICHYLDFIAIVIGNVISASNSGKYHSKKYP
jgi:hypothetical protein